MFSGQGKTKTKKKNPESSTKGKKLFEDTGQHQKQHGRDVGLTSREFKHRCDECASGSVGEESACKNRGAV